MKPFILGCALAGAIAASSVVYGIDTRLAEVLKLEKILAGRAILCRDSQEREALNLTVHRSLGAVELSATTDYLSPGTARLEDISAGSLITVRVGAGSDSVAFAINSEYLARSTEAQPTRGEAELVDGSSEPIRCRLTGL